MDSNSYLELPGSFAFIGLGAMGYPMARQLRRKLPSESNLIIYDINPVVLDRFKQEHRELAVIIAKNAKEAALMSDFIITIVPEGSHVRAVYLDPEVGLLAAHNVSEKIFVDCSTIDPATSLQVRENVSAHSSHASAPSPLFFDAPVSGGTAGAALGTLTFMVGISPDSPYFGLLHSVFSMMGTSIHALGGPGLGLAAKLSNNYLSGMIALATAEAMNLGMHLGVDPHVLRKCFQTSSGASWVNETVNPVPGVCPNAVTSKGYKGGFKVQLMKKDIRLAMEAAKEVGAKIVLGEKGLEAYQEASDDPRCKDLDSRVVYRWLGGFEPEVSKS